MGSFQLPRRLTPIQIYLLTLCKSNREMDMRTSLERGLGTSREWAVSFKAEEAGLIADRVLTEGRSDALDSYGS